MKKDDYKPFAGRWKGRYTPGVTVDPVVRGPYIRPTDARPQAKYVTHGGTAKEVTQYTGDKILGIGTMHKSNAVPIFSDQEAVDIAKMRRG